MPYNLCRETPRSGILVLCGEIGFEFGRRHVAECGAKPLSVVDFLQEVANRQLGFVQIAVVSAEVEWRGASQPRALPEPDVNLSIHPAPIIRPLVPGPNVRTALECDVLANATSPMSPLCGLETVCIYELPIAQ